MFANVGYALAIITCSCFLRDIPMIVGTGMVLGDDIVGNIREESDDSHQIQSTFYKL
jgi:hypothetical protein